MNPVFSDYAPVLCHLFYAENLTLDRRQLILSSLSDAVSHLATNPLDVHTLSKPPRQTAKSEKVKSQTRRWTNRNGFVLSHKNIF